MGGGRGWVGMAGQGVEGCRRSAGRWRWHRGRVPPRCILLLRLVVIRGDTRVVKGNGHGLQVFVQALNKCKEGLRDGTEWLVKAM